MRRRLVLLAAANTVMVALAFLVPLAVLVRTLARDRALNAAELEAQSLAPALSLTQEAAALEVAILATTAGKAGRLVIFLPDGTRVGRPESAVAGRVSDESIALARRGRAFSANIPGGAEVLVPVALAQSKTAVARVYVPNSLLRRGVASAWTMELGVGLALVALAVLLADRMARTIVRPVRALAGAAQQLGEGDLTVRIEPEGPPEIVQAASAFNFLGHRVGELLAAERELVADLSHRLRTPLTALRLDVEGVGDPEDARRLSEDVDELQRAVDAVIRQARRPVRSDVGPLADPATVARARVEFWAPLAEDQGRRWALEVNAENTVVAVSVEELEAALDALLGNVFQHTPEGTAFRVVVIPRRGGGARLAVEDEGPGVSGDKVARGTSGTGSTGLGLDIARRTAEAAGGALTISEGRRGGARIELDLPPAVGRKGPTSTGAPETTR
ncbi:MAG: HAMP domain-containing protein [Acidimicrobiia bacterium]